MNFEIFVIFFPIFVQFISILFQWHFHFYLELSKLFKFKIPAPEPADSRTWR